VDFERALETQRLALLRLLAGLAFVVVVASRAPAVSLVPQWVYASVLSVIVRIEAAVDSLMIVAVYVFCGSRGVGALASVAPSAAPEDGSAEGLLHRIAALRTILNDLPRHAKRLIKRLMRPRSKLAAATPPLSVACPPAKAAPYPVRIERPPD